MVKLLVGMDDTDNQQSRGTGYWARQMAQQLIAEVGARVHGITRHQLLIDARVPYTSHNSANCLLIEADSVDTVAAFCRHYLPRHAASGSDVGCCIARWEQVSAEVIAWGQQCKRDVVRQRMAQQVAAQSDLTLMGLTGNGDGMIGALAAVGLRRSGADGRFVWLMGLRQLHGCYTVAQLQAATPINRIETVDGQAAPPHASITVTDWVRPILRDGQAVLWVEEVDHAWQLVSKERVKHGSD